MPHGSAYRNAVQRRPGAITRAPCQPLGGVPNAFAYASFPRKYRLLMNVKTSPSGAPPSASLAVNGLVRLLSSICARVPAQLAGDSRKTVSMAVAWNLLALGR